MYVKLAELKDSKVMPQFKGNWHKVSAPMILSWAKSLADNDVNLNREQRTRFCNQSGLHLSDYSKLKRIGNDRRLEKIKHELPANFSLIYTISLMNNRQITHGIEKRIIHPGCKNADVRNLYNTFLPDPQENPMTPPNKFPQSEPIKYAAEPIKDCPPTEAPGKRESIHKIRRVNGLPGNVVKLWRAGSGYAIGLPKGYSDVIPADMLFECTMDDDGIHFKPVDLKVPEVPVTVPVWAKTR